MYQESLNGNIHSLYSRLLNHNQASVVYVLSNAIYIQQIAAMSITFHYFIYRTHSYYLSIIIGLSNGAIRKIRLVIEPVAVRRGQSAILRCDYDLDGAPLLSLQFYRGSGEFYRFSPTQNPNKKVFPLSGINVDVSNYTK
jgi:hypothetical protein